MDRRNFLKATAQGAAFLTLAGCGAGVDGSASASDSNTTGGGSTVVSALRRDASLGEQQISLFTSPGRVELRSSGLVVWETDGFNYPVAAASDGLQIYVLDKGNSEIAILDASDGSLKAVMGNGELNSPSDLVFEAESSLLYIADTLSHSVKVMDTKGHLVNSFGSLGTNAAELNGPKAIDFDSYGRLHIAELGNRRVSVFNRAGNFQSLYGQGLLESPCGLAGSGETIYVADVVCGCVLAFDSGGGLIEKIPSNLGGNPGTPIFVNISHQGDLQITAVRAFSA